MTLAGRGERCAYCERTLMDSRDRSKLAATKDHIFPQSRYAQPLVGGKVWCCRVCNGLKADMHPEEWKQFMLDVPEWWKHGLDAKRIWFRKRRERFAIERSIDEATKALQKAGIETAGAVVSIRPYDPGGS